MDESRYMKRIRSISTTKSLKKLHISTLCICLIIIIPSIYAQQKYSITHNDSLALEKVIVEQYYSSDSTDYIDTSAYLLPKGAITYRIFIDMKPGYSLQVIYGNQQHELFFRTTTSFFNNQECVAMTGFNIDAKQLSIGTVALDSWITMGAASRLHTGILRSEDNDDFSFITNRKSLSEKDGLTKSVLPNFRIFGLNLKCFNDSIAGNFSTNNGGWAAPGGVKGPTPENKVLIAQLTTNGKLSFGLNVQIGTPDGGYVQFVARDPEGSEIHFEGLMTNDCFREIH
jgi:hypothetical protein